MHIYRTKEQEDVYSVARNFGISPVKLAEINDLNIKGKLPLGREMLVIIPTRTYNVKSGDTLERISRRFDVKKESLLRLNPELGGRETVYQGQLLNVKSGTESYGMINTNGYYYRGCNIDRLLRIIPYLGYVTFCSAVYKSGVIHTLFQTEDAVMLTKSLGRVPMVRIYMSQLPAGDEIKSFANSAAIYAKTGGFAGVTLSSIGSFGLKSEEADALVFALRKELMRSDLLLFTEGDCEAIKSYMEYADAGILTYDKLHKSEIPSFEEGEKCSLEKFANEGESIRTFIEFSSFAYCRGKYIEKSEALRITDKKHGEIIYDDAKKISRAIYGKSGKNEIVYESLENTKSKLELLSELGYLGVCFDILRVCTADIMMLSEMFSIITSPVLNVTK